MHHFQLHRRAFDQLNVKFVSATGDLPVHKMQMPGRGGEGPFLELADVLTTLYCNVTSFEHSQSQAQLHLYMTS